MTPEERLKLIAFSLKLDEIFEELRELIIKEHDEQQR